MKSKSVEATPRTTGPAGAFPLAAGSASDALRDMLSRLSYGYPSMPGTGRIYCYQQDIDRWTAALEKPVTRYILVEADHLPELEAIVQQHVAAGGVACGGPFNCARHVKWVQAILSPNPELTGAKRPV